MIFNKIFDNLESFGKTGVKILKIFGLWCLWSMQGATVTLATTRTPRALNAPIPSSAKRSEKPALVREFSKKTIGSLVFKLSNAAVRVITIPSETFKIEFFQEGKGRTEDIRFFETPDGKGLIVDGRGDERHRVSKQALHCTLTIPSDVHPHLNFKSGKLQLELGTLEGDLTVSAGLLICDGKDSLLYKFKGNAGKADIALGTVRDQLFLNCAHGLVKIGCGPTEKREKVPENSSEKGKTLKAEPEPPSPKKGLWLSDVPSIFIRQAAGQIHIGLPSDTRVFFPNHREVKSDFRHTYKDFEVRLFLDVSPAVKVEVHSINKGENHEKQTGLKQN